jgi:hypothetical protein
MFSWKLRILNWSSSIQDLNIPSENYLFREKEDDEKEEEI